MIDPLRTSRRLGPVLFQLPPAMKCDVALLGAYLDLLPPGMRYAFEFRHPSWLVDEVYEALRERNISLCVAESEKLEVPEVITADFVYYRLRKPDTRQGTSTAFAARSRELLATGRDLYLMFKHEETPEGALNAEGAEACSRLRSLGSLAGLRLPRARFFGRLGGTASSSSDARRRQWPPARACASRRGSASGPP